MATDDKGRIRVFLAGGTHDGDCYGWATSAPASSIERSGGYTVEWDDGVQDDPETRWYFDNGDYFDIKEV